MDEKRIERIGSLQEALTMWIRISGLLLRTLYLYRRSLTRAMEILF